MKRLVFIVEGDSELRFVKEVLGPYFHSSGLYNGIQCFKLKHSGTLYEQDAVVTTMVDFYRLPSDFPGFAESSSAASRIEQVEMLEQAFKIDIEKTQARIFDNLIPYIQLHEFEALVFSSLNGFEEVFERSEMDYKGLKEVISGYPNPEEIDNSPDTAPAARLKALIPGYNKVLNGVSIIKVIKETGIGTVLERCPHFRAWVEKLKQAVK